MNISDIGKEMVTQSNRSTQYPLFVIQAEKRVWVAPGQDYDERQRAEDLNEFYLCESCEKLHDSEEELPDECEACDEEAFDHFRIEHYYDLAPGVFFTAKACDEHIASNHYHYRNPRSYGISAWRNYEMQEVMRHIIGEHTSEIPSHYRGA